MRTSVSLPDALFEAAEQLAKRLGMSRSELYAIAIEEYLKSYRSEGVTEALNRIYLEEPSNLDPVIAAIQAASLPLDPIAELIPHTPERQALAKLAEERAVEWHGGKPKGLRGIVVQGEPVSETIIRDRRES